MTADPIAISVSFPHTPSPRPRLGKRERTRARLIAATLEVLATMGHDNTTVLEITRVADVSNGTFYLHFKDKAEAVDVAVVQVAQQIMQLIHEAEIRIERAPERAAFAIRQLFDKMPTDQTWMKAMLATYRALPAFRRNMREYMLDTVHVGIEQGTFVLRQSDLLIESLMAVVTTALEMRLTVGPESSLVVEDCIELALRMVGVGVPEAQRLSRGPLK